jgi:hypothetical protein
MNRFVKASNYGQQHTGWFQGAQIGSKFHLLVSLESQWDGKTACGRRINQYDTWDKPGIPGAEYTDSIEGMIGYGACPRCMKILEREDPEGYQSSLTIMKRVYEALERCQPEPEYP